VVAEIARILVTVLRKKFGPEKSVMKSGNFLQAVKRCMQIEPIITLTVIDNMMNYWRMEHFRQAFKRICWNVTKAKSLIKLTKLVENDKVNFFRTLLDKTRELCGWYFKMTSVKRILRNLLKKSLSNNWSNWTVTWKDNSINSNFLLNCGYGI
jgi:hypothetical protein